LATIEIKLNLPLVAPRKGKKKKKKNRLVRLKKSYDSAEMSLSKLVKTRVFPTP
jgi:hypothetical protein